MHVVLSVGKIWEKIWENYGPLVEKICGISAKNLGKNLEQKIWGKNLGLKKSGTKNLGEKSEGKIWRKNLGKICTKNLGKNLAKNLGEKIWEKIWRKNLGHKKSGPKNLRPKNPSKNLRKNLSYSIVLWAHNIWEDSEKKNWRVQKNQGKTCACITVPFPQDFCGRVARVSSPRFMAKNALNGAYGALCGKSSPRVSAQNVIQGVVLCVKFRPLHPYKNIARVLVSQSHGLRRVSKYPRAQQREWRPQGGGA